MRGAWLVMLTLGFLVPTSIAQAGTSATTEPYRPLFQETFRSEEGTLTDGYMKAHGSPTREAAIKAWEKFIAENVPAENDEFADVTELTLVSLAHFELARLYYLAGRADDADGLMRRADEMVVYATPKPEEAARWCRRQGHGVEEKRP